MATFGRDLPLSRAKLKNFTASQRSLSSASSVFRYESRATSPESLSAFRLPSRMSSLVDLPSPTAGKWEDGGTKSKAQVVSEFVWTEKNQMTLRRPMTRDVSYRRDLPLRKSLSTGQRELAEALGIEVPKLELFPLPTNLKKLEEMFLEKQARSGAKVQTFDPAPEQFEDHLEQPMEEFDHQRFIEEIDGVKRKASQYHISKDKEAIKEGGLLFKTKSGLLKETVQTKAPTAARSRPVQPLVDFSKPVHLNDGKPSGQQEIELLAGWLDYMTYVHISQGNYESIHQKTRAAQLIYTMCFRELIRQVSVHCSARGLLMDRIWNSSVEIFAKSEFAFVKQLDELKRKFREVVAKSLRHYEEKLSVVTKKYATLNAELRKETSRADEKEAENEELKMALARERKRLKDMQDAIKTLANASIASKVEEERKRLAEEFAKLRIKPQISKRTVSTSTTEDEYMLNESLEVSSVPTLSLKKVAPKTVLLQGHYDDKGRFHKTHELKTDAKGNVEIMDFTDALVTAHPAYHKETNTEEDLGWTFFDKKQMEVLAKRSFDITEEEIGKGLWVSDYKELLAERKHRDMNLVCALKSLWVIRHPVLTGTKSRGTQLFGHEVREEHSPHSQSSSNSSFEIPPPTRRDSVEVEYKVRTLEDFLGKAEASKAASSASVGRVGLELIKTVEAAESQDCVNMPLSVLTAMGKMMISSAFGVKLEQEPIAEEEAEHAEASEEAACQEMEVQTDAEPLPVVPQLIEAETQTEVPELTPAVSPEPSPDIPEVPPNASRKRVTWQQHPALLSKVQLRRSHPGSKVLIELLQSGKLDSEAIPDLRAAMHLKTLMKATHYFYIDRLANIRENPATKRIALVESLYETLLAKHGLKSVAEKKLRDVLITAVVCSEKSQRVSMFVDFAGLRDRYFDETACENYVVLERAEHVFKTFAEGKISQRRIDEGMRSVQQLMVHADVRGQSDRLSIDSLLFQMIELYQDMKKKLQGVLRIEKAPTDPISLTDIEMLLNRFSRYRDLLPSVMKELSYHLDPSDTEKTLRVDTLLSVLVDLGGYREADQA